MSKIGKKPVVIPAGVEVQLNGSHIQVKGSKGTLERDIPAAVTAKVEGSEIKFTIDSDEHKNLWGLSRTIVNNMCVGVSEGYEKRLLII
jgi:large subunit ribosomal protein L6